MPAENATHASPPRFNRPQREINVKSPVCSTGGFALEASRYRVLPKPPAVTR